jgi:hypothetical protein
MMCLGVALMPSVLGTSMFWLGAGGRARRVAAA